MRITENDSIAAIADGDLKKKWHSLSGPDRKGLVWFLLITFGLTIILAAGLRAFGAKLGGTTNIIAQIGIMAAMFFPGASAVFVNKYILKRPVKNLGFVWGKVRHYFDAYGAIIGLFFIVFSVTALVFPPDLTLAAFEKVYGAALPARPPVFLLVVFAVSLLISPVLNFLPSLGEELGWRGFLLPSLLPLGTPRALVISGVIWGLWHVPFILLLGFAYPQNNRLLGSVLFVLFACLLGIYFGYLRLISKGSLLPAFAHGVFNSQAYGVWAVLFPAINKLLGGMTGLIGIIFILPLAWWSLEQAGKIHDKNVIA